MKSESKKNAMVDHKGKMKLGYNKITSRKEVDHNNQGRWIDLLKLLFSCFYIAGIHQIHFKKTSCTFSLYLFKKSYLMLRYSLNCMIDMN